MSSRFLIKALCFAFVLCCWLIYDTFPALAEKLLLKNAQGGEIAHYALAPSQRFAIRYIHSVAQTPVEDHFRLKNGKIILDKTVYHDFGAGLPHQPEGSQSMRLENGSIVITGYQKEFSSFDLRVGRVAKHTLLLPDIKADSSSKSVNKAAQRLEIPLDTLAHPGDSITFSVGNGR